VVLPGAREMQREVSARLRERQPFAYCAIDIVGLKDGVEAAGFMWGHQAMAHTAEVVHDVLAEHADGRAFLGHERDDDFVFLVAPEHIEAVSREIVRAFAALGPVISAEGAPKLRLSITAIIDSGQYSRFSALRAALGRARRRDTGEIICIQR
jgi:GGDEF domain-containing protein